MLTPINLEDILSSIRNQYVTWKNPGTFQEFIGLDPRVCLPES